MKRSSQCVPDRGRRRTRRKGSVLVLSAFLMIVMFAMVAFSVDLGYILTAQSEIQRSVDAASLAGVGMLAQGEDLALDTATEYLARNPVADPSSVGQSPSAQLAAFQQNHADDYNISIGHWDPSAVDPQTGQLGAVVPADGSAASAVHVTFQLKDHPLFFGPVLGTDTFSVKAEAIAVYRPRDLMLVLDYSGSMNDDTELKSIGNLGREVVEGRLLQCWQDMNSQTYGSLDFQPQYATVSNSPSQSGEPLMTVEYRYKSVQVTSTDSLQWVKVKRSDGSWKTFYPSGSSGTFSYYNKPLYEVRVKSNGFTHTFDFSPSVINDVIKDAFGLTMSYPYSGSWDGYINYCKSGNNANKNAGYRYQFGMMNLINYWLEKRNSYSQTPILHTLSAQPVTAVKKSVDVFMDFITEVDTDDRVGLSVYNAPGGEGLLEQPLTSELENNAAIAWVRQAGHYHDYTNIGGGMEVALDELIASGRPNALKVIVLMTDGIANWSNGQYNLSAAVDDVIDLAYEAKSHNIPIVTISLGANADTELMQQVADITGAEHYNVPFNVAIEVVEADLTEVFRKIADDRPLQIVR